MWEIVQDALKDSLVMLPFLFALYVLIELLENNQSAQRQEISRRRRLCL